MDRGNSSTYESSIMRRVVVSKTSLCAACCILHVISLVSAQGALRAAERETSTRSVSARDEREWRIIINWDEENLWLSLLKARGLSEPSGEAGKGPCDSPTNTPIPFQPSPPFLPRLIINVDLPAVTKLSERCIPRRKLCAKTRRLCTCTRSIGRGTSSSAAIQSTIRGLTVPTACG